MKKIILFIIFGMAIIIFWKKFFLFENDQLKIKKIEKMIEYNEKEQVLKYIEENFPDLEKVEEKDRIVIYNVLEQIYVSKTDYAKASEMGIKAIKIAEKLGENDIYRKISIEMALLFKRMGGFDSATKFLNQVLNTKGKNKKKDADLEVYALLNLIEIEFEKNRVDLVEKNIEKIKKYRKDFSEEDFNDILILVDINLAKCALEKKEILKAEEYLKIAEKKLEKDKEEYYHEKEIPLKISKSDLLLMKGEKEKSKEILSSLLEYAKKEKNKYLELKIYRKLEKIETDVNKKNNYLENILKIIDEEKNGMYKNYSKTIKSLIEAEIEIESEYKIKIRVYIGLFIGFLSLSGLIIYLGKLKYISEKDGLTGLYNRKKFDEIYRKLLNQKKYFSLIVLDVDNFKKINDTYGHSFGDYVLIEEASVLKKICQKEKKIKIFRYGGEEFVILGIGIEKKVIKNLAENIRRGIEENKWENGIKVTVSIGVSNSDESRKVFEDADKKLYISKTTGKNRVTI